ncbi:MAG: hypothetical protein JOZ15_22220 [Acidobacteria bacterium]|nr:hypothetical protein [Acidobacteriota bacterium]
MPPGSSGPRPGRGGPHAKLTVASTSPGSLPVTIAGVQSPTLNSSSISTEPGMKVSPLAPENGATIWPVTLPVVVSEPGST